MKKLFFTSAATLLAVAAFAQGTVAFSNDALKKISSGQLGSASGTWLVVPTTAGLINYGLFYGIGQSSSLTLAAPLGVNSTLTAGVIANSSDTTSLLSVFSVPGTIANETDVWLQIRGWSASFGSNWAAAQTGAASGNGYFGQTPLINVASIGAAVQGPGAVIWQSASGTDPNKFKAAGLTLFTTTVPEPTTMALAGLGVAAMLIFRRRK